MELNQENIITLIFHNYSPTPVVQKWSSSTLRMLPFFASLLDGPWKDSVAIVGDTANRSYIMDCDPNDFIQVVDGVRYGKKDKIIALSDTLGIDLESKCPYRLEIPKKFDRRTSVAFYNLKEYPIAKILSLRWIASEPIIPWVRKFTVCFNQNYHNIEQRKALVERMNEKLDMFGAMGEFFIEASPDATLSSPECSKELEMWLTLVIEYE